MRPTPAFLGALRTPNLGGGGRTCPSPLRLIAERLQECGEPLFLLQVVVSDAFSSAPRLLAWCGGALSGSSVPAEHFPFVLGCSTQCRSRIFLCKGGREGTTEMTIVWEAVVGEVLELHTASSGRRGCGVEVPRVAVCTDPVENQCGRTPPLH